MPPAAPRQVRGSQQPLRAASKAQEPPAGIWPRAVIIAVLGAFAYSNSLSGPFIFDDHVSILENPHIRQWWRLDSVLFPGRELPVAGRPLVNLSFAVNYVLGGFNVMGYHIVNIAFHLLCALLVFGVVRRTMEGPGLKAQFGARSTNLAFAVALLWTLHPLNTEAVNYVTQRTELMMALFYLLALYASSRAWHAAHAGGWQAIAVVSCMAGMACKESMATAPLMVVLYDGAFLFGSLILAIRNRWPFYIGLATSWIVLAGVMWSGPRVHSAGFSSGASPWTYLLNQTIMITEYLRLSVWPRSLVINYGWPLPLTVSDVIPYALLVVSLMALTIIALVRQPKWGFLGAWFFIALAPTSSLVPIATEVGAERRMYLPLIALIVLAVVGFSFIKQMRFVVAASVLIMCSAAFAAGTLARNREYASDVLLARTIVDRRPTSVGHHVLAAALVDAGQQDEAIVHLRKALPDDPRAHNTLGVVLFRQGKTSEAIDELQAFVREQPMRLEAVSARQLLGQAFARQQQWPQAIEQYRLVLTMNPSYVQRIETQALLGEALFGAEDFREAIDHYREYLKARLNDGAAWTHLAAALVAADRLDEAIDAFRRAVDSEPSNGDWQRNLAAALFDRRDVDGALGHAERAVALRPEDPAAHDLLGRVLADQGKFREAQAQFERALQIAPNDPDALEDLAKLRRFVASLATPQRKADGRVR